MTRSMRWMGSLLLFAVLSTSCVERPVISAPADGTVVLPPASGGIPVTVELGSSFGEGSSFRITLLSGIDSPPANLVDVSADFSEAGGVATGEIDPSALAPGRNTIFAAISADGDETAENVVTSSFSWEPDLDLANAEHCDLLDPGNCLYPFPSDFHSRPDATTDTGRRIDLAPESLPSNFSGDPIDPTEWNRSDGFSPGQALQLYVPGVVLRTPAADPADPPTPAPGGSPEWDLAASLAPDADVVILDSTTGERVPHWSEVNSRLPAGTGQMLIRPAVNFASGGHYIVAIRNLEDGAGEIIPANRAFQLYRDAVPTFVPAIEARRDHMENLFATLEQHGVPRHDLYLAWDFTVISKRSVSERLVHMRDDAFAKLGNAAPNFVIDSVEPISGIRWRVNGRVEVPNYLTNNGESFLLDFPVNIPPGRELTRLYCEDETGQPRPCQGDELPSQARLRCEDESFVEKPCEDGDEPVDSPTYWADFRCVVPASTIGSEGEPVPARPSLYGHGLLGSQNETGASHVRAMAAEHNFVFCGTRWIGMGDDDLATVSSILSDFSRFSTLADRLHQAMLNFMFLGRAMIHPAGFGTHEAFQTDGTSIIDGSELFYDGNSQGAIAGGALAAVAQDHTRAVLGVPGMNYSTLLFRSVDFDPFLAILSFFYQPTDFVPVIGLAQMLWDRVETNGHANHLTSDTYPNTPPKKILLHVAFGDFQVSDASANVEARTIGASMHRVGFDPAAYAHMNPSGDPRPFWQADDPYWNIPGIPDSDPGPAVPGVANPDYRFDGSAMIVWDSGNLQSPNANLTPGGGNPELAACPAGRGGDPHECPRRQPLGRIQKSEFLKSGGAVLDVCEDTLVGFPATVLDVCVAPLP